MNDDARRWTRVKQVFQDALERPEDERGPFVLAACGDDRELKGEVESLLVAHAAAGSFAQGPAIEALPPSAADAFANPSNIPSGAVPRYIGSYEVLSFLGSGGMGEVYRARDSRLGREVAIKVLPDTFSQDPEHQARLEREAQILAALNHPHIAQVYGFENAHSTGSGERTTHALVMELVEGETLTQRAREGIAARQRRPSPRHPDRGRTGRRSLTRHRPSRLEAGQRDDHAGRRQSPRFRSRQTLRQDAARARTIPRRLSES